ncbi:cytochrome P450 [Streptacidiphilus sp. EB103A]|uniref:cytochrome P450 n=1 Tax=Streptacidiphilus sp. EB103A TaxID=3156275 RepID=UPI003518DEB9
MTAPPRPGTGPLDIPTASGGLPLIGHLHRFAANPLRAFEELRSAGPLVRIRIGPRTVYVVNSVELVHHMLITGRADYDKGGSYMDPLRELMGDSLAVCSDDVHHVQRPLLQPAFHRSRLPGYLEGLAEVAVQQVESWHPQQVLDVNEEMDRLSTGGLTRSIFRDPVATRSVQQFQRDLPLVLDGFALRVALPALGRLPLPVNRRFDQAVRRSQEAFREMIAHRRAHPGDHDDLLTFLLLPEHHDKGLLTDELAALHLWGFMIGGIETTASLLSWTLHTLATRPDHHQRVREEIDTVLGGRPPTYQDTAHLPYVHSLFTEMLRLYPPVWLLSRTTRRATDLGGHRLPAGADVVFSIWTLHRDPTVFHDPGTLAPDRWQDNRPPNAHRPGYLPFGAGSRKCIGDSYAVAMATLTLAVILQRHTLIPAPDSNPTPRARMALRPAGLRLTVQPRTPV